jgi:hypothetical protein
VKLEAEELWLKYEREAGSCQHPPHTRVLDEGTPRLRPEARHALDVESREAREQPAQLG